MSACGDDGLVSGRWCNTPGRWFSLILIAVGISLISLVVVWRAQRRQLAQWDLRASAENPRSRWAVVLPVAALIGSIVFSFLISDVEGCAPARKLANVLALFAGACIVSGACVAGLILAKRSYEGSYRK